MESTSKGAHVQNLLTNSGVLAGPQSAKERANARKVAR